MIAQQQEETSQLVDKQSSEMLEMMQEKKKDLEADLEEIQKEINEAVIISIENLCQVVFEQMSSLH